MEFEEFEDVLFGVPLSHGSFADARDDEFDDEILEAQSDGEDILWDLGSSPTLTPALTANTPDKSTVENLGRAATASALAGSGRPARAIQDRDWVIARIEEMLETVVDGLLDDAHPVCITLTSRSGLTRRRPNPSEANEAIPSPRVQQISFPGSNAQEAWRFTVLVRILELVHSCLVDNAVMTKRDMYYRHPDLFMKQSVVDRYVDDLACTLRVSRSQLNVTAAAKGLVAGNFLIRRENGTVAHGLSEDEGILIPKVHDSDELDLSLIRWILVMEKEATFRSLLSSSRWRELGSHGLVLTAKGYPDLASRKLLRQLADEIPHIPMYAFVDFDPDGIAIMSTYKHGSYRLAHEDVTSKDTPGLHLPDLQWLGVQSHHISQSPVTESDTETGPAGDPQGLMRLTARDRKKAHRMLEWDMCAEDGPEPVWREELQRMLMLNIKAEMQILDELPGGLVAWLSSKLDVLQGSRSPVLSICSDNELLF